MKKISSLLLGVILMSGMLLTSCQDSPVSSELNTNDELTREVTPGSKVSSSIVSLSSTTPLVILDAGSHHNTAYFPADGNYFAWSDGRYPNRTNYGLYDDEILDGSVIDFKSGDYTNCVLNADGTTTCVGYLGNELSYDGSSGPARSFDVGYGQSCIINVYDEVYCAGNYLVGSSSWNIIYSDEIEDYFNFTGKAEWIIMSSYAVCIKTQDSDALRCRGWNVTEPNWTVQGTPTPNGEGHYAMCILTEEGNVDCMNNTYNEVGQTAGYYGGDVIAFDANFDQACYLKDNGDIGCFGRNTYDGTMSITGKNAIAVSVSNNNDICYATADGEITCTRSTPDEYSSTNGGGGSTNVFISDASVTTYDPILPSSEDRAWSSTVCYQGNDFGITANWVNPHNAFVVTNGGQPHPWDNATFDAAWINSYNSMDSNVSNGPGGHNWSKYETDISGNGEFVVQLLADNCSWVYLSDENGNNPQLIGYQPAVSTPGEYGVTLDGAHKLTFVIFDGGGLAGGKFRLETTESYGGTPPPPIDTNEAPVADAGADQSVTATGSTTSVTLDGSGSSDADGDALSYSWMLNGSEVSTAESFNTNLADGSYTLTLTVSDGQASNSDEVNVTVVNTIPVANAGADQTIEATGATTSVTLNGSGTDADGDALSYSWSNGASGASTTVNLGLGVHTFTLTVTDGTDSDSDEVTITIVDTTEPVITFNQQTNSLWPPNHKMVLVASGISAADLVDDNVNVSISVTSSESDNGSGDGNTTGDYEIVANGDGSFDVYLRAERSGNNGGRTYTVTVTATDFTGNASSSSFTASVGHDQGADSNKPVKKNGKGKN